MKRAGINPDAAPRVAIDARMREPLRLALDTEAISVEEAIFLLARQLAELAEHAPPEHENDRLGYVLGQVVGAFYVREHGNPLKGGDANG